MLKSSNNYKLRYEEYSKRLNKRGCSLLLSEQEFIDNKINNSTLCTYNTSCGHIREIKLQKFFSSNTSHICIKCNNENKLSKLKKNFIIYGNNYCFKLEKEGFNILKEIINNSFNIIKLNEGTKADCLIKPKNIIDDKWLSIQIKTTRNCQNSTKSNNVYRFSFEKKNYPNILLCLICINEKKIWLLTKDTSQIGSLTIGTINYNKYLVNSNNIQNKLKSFYEKIPLTKELTANIPQAPTQIIEMNYRRKREIKLNFLKFEYPEYEGSVYDFLINSFKIQEKSTKSNKNEITNFIIGKSNGSRKIKNCRQPYEYGDNDYYWFHFSDEEHFMIIPEYKLIEYKYISNSNIIGKKNISLSVTKSNNTNWAKEYLFNYTNLEIERIKWLFCPIYWILIDTN